MSLDALQNRQGKRDLAQFICNRGRGKVVNKCLAIVDELATAEAKLERFQKSRLQLLREMHKGECVAECNGQWLAAAINLLKRNEIAVNFFAQAVYILLEQGRQKYRNLYIHGVANCGKSFFFHR